MAHTVVFDEPGHRVSFDAWQRPISSRVNAADSLPDAPVSPVFEEPWQAHAFAMTVSLHERGVFTWSEWSHALSQEISRGGELLPSLG